MTHADKGLPQPRRKPRGSGRTASSPSSTPPIAEITSTDFPLAPKRSRFESKVAEATELTQDELIEREAIRNLWPLLSSSEQRKHKDLIDPPKSASLSKKAAEVRRYLA